MRGLRSPFYLRLPPAKGVCPGTQAFLMSFPCGKHHRRRRDCYRAKEQPLSHLSVPAPLAQGSRTPRRITFPTYFLFYFFSISPRMVRAAARASSTFETSAPPAMAPSGRPPPRPPVICATAPTSLPACAPRLTASAPAQAAKFSLPPSTAAMTATAAG